MSHTITVCRQVVVFPVVSTAVHVTQFVPTGKASGELLVTTRTPQFSLVASGRPKLTATLHWPRLLVVTMSAGQVSVGASLSITVTVC